jgi:hypothetical protein
MSRTELLKKLLSGFIPLFVFIAADEIWGKKTGLFVAVDVDLIHHAKEEAKKFGSGRVGTSGG